MTDKNGKEVSLSDFMKEYGQSRNKMNSIALSINAKERKIAVLKKEYQQLAVESQKYGWKKIAVGFEDFKQAVQKYFKHKGVAFEVELPMIESRWENNPSKEAILYEIKARNKDWMKITAYTRYDCEEMHYPINLSAIQADGKTLQDHIKIKKIEKNGKSFYQLCVDENVLVLNFRFDECLVYTKNSLMYAKDFKGATLKYLIEKENAATSDSEEAKEV